MLPKSTWKRFQSWHLQKQHLWVPTARGPGQGNLLLLKEKGRWTLCRLGLLGSPAKDAALLWRQMLLWRSDPGSSARSLNSCLTGRRTSLLASSATANSSGSASLRSSRVPPPPPARLPGDLFALVLPEEEAGRDPVSLSALTG